MTSKLPQEEMQRTPAKAPDPFYRLHMQGVRKRFGATLALAGVDLDVMPGEVHAIVGENGAGKSTLMKVLAGAHPADEGRILLDGQAYAPRDPADGRRAGVVMVYQELSLAQHLSVMENLLLGMEPCRGPFVRWSELRRRTVDALGQVGHGDIRPETRVADLPVAQQQLVEIARACAIGCRVLVLDEPTSSLGREDVRRLFDLIRRLRAEGVSVLYISHVLEEVLEISDRYTVLRDGLSVGGGATIEAAVPGIVARMVGRDMSELYPRTPRTPGEAVLDLHDVTGVALPHSVALTLHRGEVIGIAGLIGAGRTELLRTLFGLDRVTSGDIRICGYVGPASPARRWAQGVGLVSEDRKREGLALNLSIADNVTLPRLAGLGPMGLVRPSAQDRACGRWIERMSIRCRAPRQRVSDLSGGNQQKAAIARLLHADCDVLLLDEPTRGIDVGAKAMIYHLIDEWVSASADRRRAVLMVSSYLPELLGACDRIAVMCRGRLGPARPVSELDEHAVMMEAVGAGGAA